MSRYAQLGISEYFLYDRAKGRLSAYRLDGSHAKAYTAILPQHGLYESRVLGLDVQVEKDRLRFYAGTAMLLESEELIARLEQMLDEAQQRVEEEAARRREEAEKRREAEAEAARLRAELERLKPH